ncbi:MAG: sugar phosphate isomerase/epimerase family protein [Spirochaetales bacterium]
MYLSAFADEAADTLEGQIQALKELGIHHLEARSIEGVNIHDLSEEKFEETVALLTEAGVQVNCFGSTIANWGTPITTPFEDTLKTAQRALKRMQRLNTKLVRIMSYAILVDSQGRALKDQQEEERFHRLRVLTDLFLDGGVQPVHENCANYGGMSYYHTLRMLEAVPKLRLVFDVGNPPLTRDYSKPYPYPMQSSWEFYQAVREAIVYVHIKDAYWDEDKNAEVYCWPEEGKGELRRILRDLIQKGYDGGFSLEPHMQVVFHDPSITAPQEQRFSTFIEYGKRFQYLLQEVQLEVSNRKA